MSGGALFGFLGHLTAKRGRDPIIITGFVLSMLSYFLMFLNLPFNSNLGETQPSDTAYITSNQYLAVFTGFILGFSDSCFNTQVPFASSQSPHIKVQYHISLVLPPMLFRSPLYWAAHSRSSPRLGSPYSSSCRASAAPSPSSTPGTTG